MSNILFQSVNTSQLQPKYNGSEIHFHLHFFPAKASEDCIENLYSNSIYVQYIYVEYHQYLILFHIIRGRLKIIHIFNDLLNEVQWNI